MKEATNCSLNSRPLYRLFLFLQSDFKKVVELSGTQTWIAIVEVHHDDYLASTLALIGKFISIAFFVVKSESYYELKAFLGRKHHRRPITVLLFKRPFPDPLFDPIVYYIIEL